MPNRRAVAIHEAGHAAASFFHRRRVCVVTIKPQDGTLGHVAYPKPQPGWEPTTASALGHMESALAGYWAEREFGFRPRLYSWEQDRMTAAEYALSIAAEGEANLWLRIANMRAERFARLRRAEIEAVADELEKAETIGMDDLRRLILGVVSPVTASQLSAVRVR